MSYSFYLRVKDCPTCGRNPLEDGGEIMDITYNLYEMMAAAGIAPDEILNGKTAQEVLKLAVDGLVILRQDPERFKHFNPSNGWGSYDGLTKWLENFIAIVALYPDAILEVS